MRLWKMGSSASKTDQLILEPSSKDNPAPTPPSYFIDDIKQPIHYYIHERLFEDDGLDWSEVLNKEDNNQDVHGSPRKSRPVTREVREPRQATKQPSPAAIRPIRSITLLGREKTRTSHGHASRPAHTPMKSSTQRSPNLRRKSTPVGFSNLKKLDFSKIDSHAQQASKAHRKSYLSLIVYLLQPVRDKPLPEILKARVVIAWLACQPIKKSLTKADDSTPDGLLHMIANGVISFAAAYDKLCRRAGLTCVLIEGVSKSFSYVPSKTLTPDMKEVWTAVHCEGSWQFVHPERICRREVVNKDQEGLRNILLDDFFMPAPEYFIHTNFPDDDAWQLLPKDCVIPSVDTFLWLPCIFPSFFKLGLKLESEAGAVLVSNNGICELEFACMHTNDRHLSLTYTLKLMDATRGSNSNIDTSKHLDAFVLHSRQNRRFRFEIKLPVVGRYKLEIFESFYGSLQLRLCQFTLICNKSLQNITHLAFSTDHMMWGPGLLCDDAGLLVPSHMVGIVLLPPRSAKERHGNLRGATSYQTTKLSFILDPHKTKDIQFFAYLRRNKTDKLAGITGSSVANRNDVKGKTVNESDEIAFYANLVTCDTNEERQLFEITIRIPHEGEFGLMITKKKFSIDKTTKVKTYIGNESAVCAYFLRASKSAQTENVHQRLAREEMVSLIYVEEPKRLQAAITKCRKVLIDENDGDLYNAELWMEYLTHKKNLNDSLHRRNIRIIDETLGKVSRYRYKAALQSRIKRVFHLRHQLMCLRSLIKDIPSLQRAATQLAAVTDPLPAVHVTMAAILLLFGEIEKKVEDWSYIQKQLDNTNGMGDAPLINRINIIDETCPSKNTIKKVITLLNEYSVDDIRGSNSAALVFYKWALDVIAILEDTDGVSSPTHSGNQGYDMTTHATTSINTEIKHPTNTVPRDNNTIDQKQNKSSTNKALYDNTTAPVNDGTVTQSTRNTFPNSKASEPSPVHYSSVKGPSTKTVSNGAVSNGDSRPTSSTYKGPPNTTDTVQKQVTKTSNVKQNRVGTASNTKPRIASILETINEVNSGIDSTVSEEDLDTIDKEDKTHCDSNQQNTVLTMLNVSQDDIPNEHTNSNAVSTGFESSSTVAEPKRRETVGIQTD